MEHFLVTLCCSVFLSSNYATQITFHVIITFHKFKLTTINYYKLVSFSKTQTWKSVLSIHHLLERMSLYIHLLTFFFFPGEISLSREGGGIVSSLTLFTAKSSVPYFTNTLGLCFQCEIFH